MVEPGLLLLVLVILLFDFVNGFHDAGNAIASAIATRALSPLKGILLAAFFHFLGAVSGTQVAVTVGERLLDVTKVDGTMLVSAVLTSLLWNLLTWRWGLPSSSSHAIIGSLCGIAVFAAGSGAVRAPGAVLVVLGLFILPPLSLFLGFRWMQWLYGRNWRASPGKNRVFRKIQLVSASVTSFAHGSNDAQKSMGLLTLGLWQAGYIQSFAVPTAVKLGCAAALSLGTVMGGWRIMKTMGQSMYRLEPINGLTADLNAGGLINLAACLGLPASTTQVVTASILGVGMAKRVGGIRWHIPLKILCVWCVTIPLNALAGIMIYHAGILIRTMI